MKNTSARSSHRPRFMQNCTNVRVSLLRWVIKKVPGHFPQLSTSAEICGDQTWPKLGDFVTLEAGFHCIRLRMCTLFHGYFTRPNLRAGMSNRKHSLFQCKPRGTRSFQYGLGIKILHKGTQGGAPQLCPERVFRGSRHCGVSRATRPCDRSTGFTPQVIVYLQTQGELKENTWDLF